ncbi:MAG: glycosyltransferase [Glaciimonas sp.]|nr:glycosyltransferase [Glaciimonas sp.]
MNEIKDQTLVTLAIISYNQEKFIRGAVESALAQTYSPMEVVISDDSSSDRTLDIIHDIVSSYKGPHKITVNLNPTNIGLAGNLNKVLSLCKGEIICWAAGDDISLPGKIEALVTPLLQNKLLSGTHSYVNEIDADGIFLKTRRPSVPDIIDSPEQVVVNALEVISQSHAFRRLVYERFGPFSLTVTNESPVMAFRVACLGGIFLVKKPLTEYRVGVGISTYHGKNIEELSILEPLKYSNWWASAYKQIALDSHAVQLSPDLRGLISKRVRLYQKIFQVNALPMNVSALCSALFRRGFFKVFKAFSRRNAPKIVLFYIYRFRGWV